MILRISLCLLLFCSSIQAIEKNIPELSDKTLFYIQRSCNKNIVVYEANYDKNGQLSQAHPIRIYWIMLEKDGKTENLNLIEQKFAYGIEITSSKADNSEFSFQLVSMDQVLLKLKQTAPFKAKAYFCENKKEEPLHHIFINASNKGLWSKVRNIRLYLSNPSNNNLKVHVIEM